MSLYDRDFHAWANEQAEHARSRSANALDWDNVAEELDSLGKQERSELQSRYEVLLMHLLKWLYQPDRRTKSWKDSIRVQRHRIPRHIAKNPSLKASDLEVFAEAYENARLDASVETDLDIATFPAEPPFTPAEALDPDLWPDLSA
jgi:hypothetical protein